VRAKRGELEQGRFRELTRHDSFRAIEAMRAQEAPAPAIRYSLLSVESLRDRLDNREDVTSSMN